MANKLVYADNAATTQMSPKACEAMVDFLSRNFANASQPYSFARPARLALKESRKIIAECIGAEPYEIFFTSGGTESDNWVIKKVKSDGVITSSIEHHAVLNSCQELELCGKEIQILPVSDKGIVIPSTLEKFIKENMLVSIMLSNNEIGSVQPIKKLANIAHTHNCLFHTDAVQAVGHLHINVKELNVDFLSASAHKFNGPKGIGFLYIKNGIKLDSFINGGAQEFGLRAGTENIASIVAMATALKENINKINTNTNFLLNLESTLLSSLQNANIEFSRNGDVNHVPGNLSLSFPGYFGESLLHRLDLMGICVSTGSACDSKDTKISHVLKAIGLDAKSALGTIRISIGKDNSEEDVKYIAQSLIKILKSHSGSIG